MTTRVQGGRTATPNAPPANNSLQPGELYVEMATPLRLWTGVPTSVAAAGTKLVLDTAAQAAANAAAVQKAGDTMTGPLVLSGAPAAPAQAANKSYVDALLVSPVFTGNPTAPTPPPGDNDQSVATTAFVAASYAPIASPTFTGNPQAPTPTLGDNDQSVATTAFVASAIAAQPGTVIAPTVPAFKAGQLWWDATGGSLYVGYDDGSTQQYVPATNITLPANVALKTDVATALNNVGRNLIHNSAFTIAQRGAGPFSTTGVHTADRWKLAVSLDTVSVGVGVPGDTARAQIGDEAVTSMLTNTFTGNAGAASLTLITQYIENVRRLSGKTVILSFWATASAALKLGISVDQLLGAGGSPGSVIGVGQTVTLSTTWTRYVLTFTVGSLAGMTPGTGNDHSTALNFWYSAGTNFTSRSGGVGVQGPNATINIWGVQLEIAQPGQTQPTPLEKRDPVLELQQAQRFFQTGSFWFGAVVSGAGNCGAIKTFPVAMRALPTIVFASPGLANCTGLAATNIGVSEFLPYAAATAAGPMNFSASYTASADL